jgi:hypothetical protein
VSAAAAETRTVVIQKAPSIRLFQPGRFRTFKLPEARWWEEDLAPVRALVADGWRKVRVTLEFGGSVPGYAAWREQRARELTECHGDCELVETYGQAGRGRVVIELER